MIKKHKQKAFNKANNIFNPLNLLKLKKTNFVTLFYLILMLLIILVPYKINNFETITIKFWISIFILDIAFRLNWKKMFFHKMSKKALYIPHEMAHLIPTLIFALIAYGILRNHNIWVYITIGILAFLYIVINIPLYMVLKKRGDGNSIWLRNMYALVSSFIIVSPIFIQTGFYITGERYGVSFFTEWPSLTIVLLISIVMIWSSHIKFYYLTKKIMRVFVKDKNKIEETLLNL